MGVIIALLALSTSTAWACRCAPQALTDYFERAEVVIQVRIDRIEIVVDGDGRAYRRARFTRLHDYKNGAGVDSLRTAVDGATCGLDLQPGAHYWIFGTLAPGSTQVRSGSCDGSRAVDQDFTDIAADAVHAALLEQRRALDCLSPAPAEIAARPQLATVSRANAAITGQRSTNGAYAFTLENPSHVQRPPRIAKLLIERERKQLLELRLHGVAAAASARWVNEKLVLVRVPWSRQLRSDVLLDVERAAILSVDSAELDDSGQVQRWLDKACRRHP